MTREIGPELVARIRHVADSLEAIARGEVDSPQPFIAAYAVYINGEYDSSYGPDAIDEALEIATECNGDVVPLYATPQSHATPGKGSVQGEGTSPKSFEKSDGKRAFCDTKRGPSAWLAVAADGSESSAVYMLKEQADAAAREWGWMVVPLYAFPALWPEDEIAIEAAWERTGLTPTWPADMPQTGVRCANAMADEILRLRKGSVERREMEHHEPVAWAVVVGRDEELVYEVSTRRDAAESYLADVVRGRVVPLYRSPSLTDEERAAVEWFATFGNSHLAPLSNNWTEHAATLRKLLERMK